MNIRERKLQNILFRPAGLKLSLFHQEKYFLDTFRMEMALQRSGAGTLSELGTRGHTAEFNISHNIYYR